MRKPEKTGKARKDCVCNSYNNGASFEKTHGCRGRAPVKHKNKKLYPMEQCQKGKIF